MLMKVAVISDVHANEPALRAVLKDIRAQKADALWDLGDFVGYGPFVRPVADLLSEKADVRLAGNYDIKAALFPKHKKEWQQSKHPAKFFSFQWTYRQLRPKDKRLINSLPHKRRRMVEGMRVLLTHGSPARIDEPLQPGTPLKRFKELADSVQADLVLFGHTHCPFQKKAKGVLFVNPGSVGRSFDNDPRASYVLLHFSRGKVKTGFRRVPYDVDRTLRRMKKEGFPPLLVRSIGEARSLDDIIAEEKKNQHREQLARVIDFARTQNYEEDHSRQVALVALLLFDQLKDLHGMGERERFWLHCAGLLHDIGWIGGQASHHKTSRDMILRAGDLPFSPEARRIIALTARYHRRALPAPSHKVYRDLPANERAVVRKLAALLRIADGLDRRHVKAVDDLRCRVLADRVEIRIKSVDFSVWESSAAKKKADLFESVFKKKVSVRKG